MATLPAIEIARTAPVRQAENGVCYATFGDNQITEADLLRVIEAVPLKIAAALGRKAYYFVPLAQEGDTESETHVAEYSQEASESAVCHRNVTAGGSELVFISTRLAEDRFALAFEFFINVGHAFVEQAGTSEEFAALVWAQVEQSVRGETSQDAYDARKRYMEGGRVDEKSRHEFDEAAFSDALSIYMLSLAVDVDYYELREREYPLLAPRALAERLRKVAEMFPAPVGYEFAVRFRRRG
jgi:hypothetical protein